MGMNERGELREVPEGLRPPAWWMLWANPVFLRYVRARLRASALGVSVLITVIVSAFSFLFMPLVFERVEEGKIRSFRELQQYVARNPRQLTEPVIQAVLQNPPRVQTPEMYQRMALLPLLVIQGVILFVLGTGQVAGGMTAEADEGMVDYQRLTPMRPVAKAMGYLFGLPVREYVMFAVTLPFSGMAIWRGGVAFADWGPVALVFATSVLLYHLTGLVAGTVLKNRRWSFLLAMGLVFLLYSLVPQGARFGLPFLRYVTLWPVAMEHAGMFPRDQVEAWRLASGHTPGAGVPFFGVSFSPLVFTLVVQGSLILTLFVMVWRKWRRAEAHLLSKPWAAVLFLWLHTLVIGNALPLVATDNLFPSSGFKRYIVRQMWRPRMDEAVVMCGFYGVLTMLMVVLISIMITPTQDSQERGYRRAVKAGRRGAPVLADESSAFLWVMFMVVTGAVAWAWFTRALMGSPWFRSDPGWTAVVWFGVVLGVAALPFHALLETKGARWPFLVTVFGGVVPVLAALVVAAAVRRETPVKAVWVAGASPVAQAALAVEHVSAEAGPVRAQRLHEAAGASLRTWLPVQAALAVVPLVGLRRHWRRRRTGAIGGE